MNGVRVILVQPSHPGNIGAAARAMKVMGLRELYLVKPKQFPHESAIRMAAGADDILQQAVVVDSLQEALKGVVLAFATSARDRHLAWPTCDPKQCATQTLEVSPSQVAWVFGREHAGLTNDELALCQQQVHIATDASFSSLNLAAAVQVLCYELKAQQVTREPSINGKQAVPSDPNDVSATADEVHHFLDYLEQLLIKVEVLDPNHPKMLMRRLHRLFARSQLKKNEINILRGIFKALENNRS